MKAKSIYIIGMLIFFALMVLVEYSLPKKFVWVPTFSRYDHQPFGGAVFDDVIKVSLTQESSTDTLPPYQVVDETLYQLAMDSVRSRSILVVVEHLVLGETDREAIWKMLQRGNRIMLVSATFNKPLQDTLGFRSSYDHFRFQSLKKYVSVSQSRDSLYWCRDSVYNDERIFQAFPHLCQAYFYESDSLFTPLVRKPDAWGTYNDSLGLGSLKDGYCAITRKIGPGEITLVSTPLLFTNYGMLDHDNSDYIFRLLNQLKGLPILRTEAYGKSRSEAQETPFRYLLSQPPLRWALYMTLIFILLFMCFTARRQQRAIPVIRKPGNKTLEFVSLIGTLYFQRKDHTDLVQKKFIYFAEKLRRDIQVDVEDEENDLELARRISRKTGVNEEGVYRLLVNIRPVICGEMKVTEENMRSFIEDMNEIINHI